MPTNGYADTELFVGADANGGTAAVFCFKEKEEITSPDCWREYEYGETIEVSYRFKRPYLPEWRAIDAAVQKFVAELDQTRIAGE